MIINLPFQLIFSFFVIVVQSVPVCSQNEIPFIKELSETDKKAGISNYWLTMGSNSLSLPIRIPVIVINGHTDGPTLGLTAAIHGNELNGISIIHRLTEIIDTGKLKGRIIAIPVINPVSLELDKRFFIDDEDLNRVFPGKKDGNRSQQYAFQITDKILPHFDIHIDLHTASFGRINALYVRTDISDDTLKALATQLQPDIILDSKGEASAGSSGQTMRATAMSFGVKSLAVEYGNPQVYQTEMINRGVQGILNVLNWLNMHDIPDEVNQRNQAVECGKSYWIYMQEGGFLEVHPEVNQVVNEGELIATVRNAFGEVIKEYKAPEAGIVIGKSTNPVNMSGGRILHLGIIR